MRQLDLAKLKLFYEIACDGNMSRTAERLNMPQPSLSRALGLLEDRIQTKLFERVPSGMRLTTQGERLFAYAKKVFTEHETFQRQFFDNRDVIAGELKIITYPFIGSEWLIPNLKEFIRDHPQVDIKISLEATNPNPANADIVMATHIPYQPHLIQKPLFSNRTFLFASEKYLKKYGTPHSPEELNHHRLIAYQVGYHSADRSNNLALNYGLKEEENERKPHLEIPSLRGLINSALEGYGIVELPNYPIVLNSGLKIVLPEICGNDIMLYYIFSENRKTSKKLNTLYTYLLKNIK